MKMFSSDLPLGSQMRGFGRAQTSHFVDLYTFNALVICLISVMGPRVVLAVKVNLLSDDDGVFDGHYLIRFQDFESWQHYRRGVLFRPPFIST